MSLTPQSEVVAGLATMIQSRLATSEIELRMQCSDAQVDTVLKHLMCNKGWTDTSRYVFTDHISKNVRTRFEHGKKGVTTKKTVVDQQVWYAGDELGEGFVIKACHANEEPQRARAKRDILGMRCIERYSFTHKNYIRFDISKSVHIDSVAYMQQAEITPTCQVEIELVGLHAPYENTKHPPLLYASSLLMKANDMICVINGVPCNTELKWQHVKK